MNGVQIYMKVGNREFLFERMKSAREYINDDEIKKLVIGVDSQGNVK